MIGGNGRLWFYFIKCWYSAADLLVIETACGIGQQFPTSGMCTAKGYAKDCKEKKKMIKDKWDMAERLCNMGQEEKRLRMWKKEVLNYWEGKQASNFIT